MVAYFRETCGFCEAFCRRIEPRHGRRAARDHAVTLDDLPRDAGPGALERLRLSPGRGAESFHHQPLDGLREEIRFRQRQRDHPFGPGPGLEQRYRRPAVGIEACTEKPVAREWIEAELRRQLGAELAELLAPGKSRHPIRQSRQMLRQRAERRSDDRAGRMRRQELLGRGCALRPRASRARCREQQPERESAPHRPRRDRTIR